MPTLCSPLAQATRLRPVAWVLLFMVVVPSPRAVAQVVNPATSAKPKSKQEEQVADEETDDEEKPERLRSWELPANADMVVIASPMSRLREEDRVGAYNQPRWTAQRLFPATRIYVRPPGTFGYEHWTRIKTPRDGPTTVVNEHEVEIGLPGRVQIDLYTGNEKTGSRGKLEDFNKFEIRYALADWRAPSRTRCCRSAAR